MNAGLMLDSIDIARAGKTLLTISAHVAAGEALTVMGPSGTGKSTLLATIIGTVAPAFTVSGRVLLDGRDLTRLPPQERRIGILYQDELLFPHLTVGGNLAFGLHPMIENRAARRQAIEEALTSVGLPGFANRNPATLSGGQRARVALMRMLLAAPRALLLDEPFSRLDAPLREQMRSLVFGLARQRQIPVLMVTHDIADALAAGGDIVNLSMPDD
ncbi:MAG: ATP-binding cassette domain-containing protein [Alphaproteobacteria bacterium]